MIKLSSIEKALLYLLTFSLLANLASMIIMEMGNIKNSEEYSYTCYSGGKIKMSSTGKDLKHFDYGISIIDDRANKKVWASGDCIFTEI